VGRQQQLPDGTDLFERAVRVADSTLCEAKQAGRNRSEVSLLV